VILNYLIGIGGGLASAVLFYSASRGSVFLSLALFIFSPLPSLIAGFGWGWRAATFGGIAGALVMAIAVSPQFAVGYGIALAAPVAAITYLVYVGRASLDDGTIDWLPVGYILAAVGFLGAAVPIAVLPLFGGTYSILEPALAEFTQRFFARAGADLATRPLDPAAMKELTARMVDIMPGALAGYWSILFAVNVYIAGRVTRAAGLLPRPWPDLHGLDLPGSVSSLLLAGLAGVLVGGTPRIVGASVCGGTLVALSLAGLAVVHSIAKRRAPWVLWPLYITMPSPIGFYTLLIAAGVGLAEPIAHLRRRFGTPPGPPPPQSGSKPTGLPHL
jgi:Predicted membrane protein (DUF2232)